MDSEVKCLRDGYLPLGRQYLKAGQCSAADTGRTSTATGFRVAEMPCGDENLPVTGQEGPAAAALAFAAAQKPA